MIKKIVLIVLVFLCSLANAQDVEYAKLLVNKLASKDFSGRGYSNNGDKKAATFIASEFEKFGVKQFKTSFLKKSYFQKYSFSINTISKVNYLIYNGDTLKQAVDYLIGPRSKALNGIFKILPLFEEQMSNVDSLKAINNKDLSNTFIVTSKKGRFLIYNNKLNAAGIIYLTDNLIYSVSGAEKASDYQVIYLNEDVFNKKVSDLKISFENKYLKNHKTQNVLGYIPAKTKTDSFIVYTAHYDHVGMMGEKVYFPGANDNASGTAMVMDLAKHFSANPPEKYNVVFALFSGEEAGLYGSRYMAENPVFDLDKVKYLINLDMVGTGSDGITIVNSKVYEDYYKTFVEINENKNYLKKIKKRGEACNSDHCPFYKKGVTSFFIYTLGKEHTEYHNIKDKAEVLPFTKYNELFSLLIDFQKSL